MQSVVLSTAARVIGKSGREHPADDVLRAELKSAHGLTRAQGAQISRTVFAYFRWRGLLPDGEPVMKQIERAIELDSAFHAKADAFPLADLMRTIPAWVAAEMELTADWLKAIQSPPALWLRARPGQGNGLAGKLDHARQSALPDALLYEGAEDLFRTAAFQAGEFEIQDLNSQVVGRVCNPQSGETWWDACAGEGGKTLHLCDLMQGKGLVWASDRAEWRLQKLKRRAARANIFNQRTVAWNGGARLPTKTKFDGILVDAPCSGIGTWHRNPHARWTSTPQDVAELSAIQERLLANVIPALKPGGRLIYAVCTLARSETTAVMEKVSQRFPELQPVQLANPCEPSASSSNPLWLWPQHTGGNGMFICAWRRISFK